jgi:ATP-binding cassette subfamily B protein
MFNRSIFENIAIFKADATMDEVIAAAKRARIHNVIMKLKNQYDAKFGDYGVSLSGGQIQRIGIARAILKNAPIVIMDEGTSALDPITESKILRILNKEFEGKTVLVIAHRLSTIRNLDRILVLDNGKVIQDGTHDDLLGQEGVYADLVAAGEIGSAVHVEDVDTIKYTN